MSENGFITTLLLLFLIIGVAALFISLGNIKKEIVSTRDNVFIMIAETYLKASSAWKVTTELNSNNSSCVTLETLRDGYVEDSTIFDGYVEFEMDSEPVIYITNGVYTIKSKTLDELSLLEKEELKSGEVNFEIPYDCK